MQLDLSLALADWAPRSALGWALYGGAALWLVGAALVAWQLLHWRTLLTDVPGPPRSGGFFMGHWQEFLESDLQDVCLRLMRRWGGVIRLYAFFGEPRLIITDPVALQHIFVTRCYDYPKQRDVIRVITGLMGPGLLVIEGGHHKRQKRALQPGFSPRAIKSLEPVFQYHARHLRHCLLESIDSAPPAYEGSADGEKPRGALLIDVLRPVSRSSLDMLGDAGFGYSFGALDEPDLIQPIDGADEALPLSRNPLSRAFDEVVKISSTGSHSRIVLDILVMFFPFLLHVPWLATESRAFRKARAVLQQKAGEVVERARADVAVGETLSGQRTDLLASLMRANAVAKEREEADGVAAASKKGKENATLDKASLSDEELVAQISTLMFAGFETTSTQLSWTLLLLAQHPHVQRRLRSEIRKKRAELGLLPESGSWRASERHDGLAQEDEGRELTSDELESIEYLDWTVRETLRLKGAIHTSSRVSTLPDRIPVSKEHSPNVVGGSFVIQPGTLIIVPIEAIGRDPRSFGPDADAFRPERWGEESAGTQRFKVAGGPAFLFGPRGCIGQRFAIAEMKAVLAVLLGSLRFKATQRRIVPNRWLVSRPWDTTAGREQCPLWLSRAPLNEEEEVTETPPP